MSFKPEFLCDGEWCSNAQRFATEQEAQSSARSRFARWSVPSAFRATESDDPVNYRWDEEEGDVHVG